MRLQPRDCTVHTCKGRLTGGGCARYDHSAISRSSPILEVEQVEVVRQFMDHFSRPTARLYPAVEHFWPSSISRMGCPSSTRCGIKHECSAQLRSGTCSPHSTPRSTWPPRIWAGPLLSTYRPAWRPCCTLKSRPVRRTGNGVPPLAADADQQCPRIVLCLETPVANE